MSAVCAAGAPQCGDGCGFNSGGLSCCCIESRSQGVGDNLLSGLYYNKESPVWQVKVIGGCNSHWAVTTDNHSLEWRRRTIMFPWNQLVSCGLHLKPLFSFGLYLLTFDFETIKSMPNLIWAVPVCSVPKDLHAAVSELLWYGGRLNLIILRQLLELKWAAFFSDILADWWMILQKFHCS